MELKDMQLEKDKTRIIAFTGKARAGKDTAALIVRDYMTARNDIVPLEESHVLGIEAFAGPIKTMTAVLLDFFGLGDIMNRETLAPFIDGELKEVLIPAIGASPRKLMQTLGTEWGRSINVDLWVNSMCIRLSHYGEAAMHGYKGAVVIVTDCRFDNEAAMIRDLGGHVIKIERMEAPPEVGVAGHQSEAGVKAELVTSVVSNNGTVEELKEALIKALVELDAVPIVPTETQLEAMFDVTGSE